MMKTTSKIRGQCGAAMVEFAIVLTVLAALLIGTVEFSLLLYNKAMITNASREGARLGIVWDSPTTTHPSCGEIGTRAEQYARDHLITFATPSPDPVITRCIYPESQDPTVPCPADCLGFGTELPGDFLRVEVNYTYDFLVIDILLAWAFGNVVDLEAVTIMRFE